jgi:uncharacterized protein YjiS (DUF1127 family)
MQQVSIHVMRDGHGHKAVSSRNIKTVRFADSNVNRKLPSHDRDGPMSNRLLLKYRARLQSPYPFGRPSTSVAARLRLTWRRWRTRQRIAQLDNHLLKDIGVSFAEAEAEANKPFWRA